MKKIKQILIDCHRNIFQFFVLIIAFLFPLLIDLFKIISIYINSLSVSKDNLIIYICNQIISTINPIFQNSIIGILLVLFLLFKVIRPMNKSIILNTGNQYHNHCYLYYYLCAKVLGYKKCSLILVPFYQQIKLIMNDIFDEYILERPPYQETNDEVKIININFTINSKEINIILEDTYPISNEQLPLDKKQLPTIRIKRISSKIRERVYCKNFITETVNQLGKLPENSSINIFSTTNPKHFYEIVKNGLTLGERSNILHIVVYQQENSGNRNFNEPHKIL